MSNERPPNNKWIVITGNPVDGLFFYGPFDTPGEATQWAERQQAGMQWWTAPIDTLPCSCAVDDATGQVEKGFNAACERHGSS